MAGKFPQTGDLTIGQREARQPGKTKRGRVNAHNAVRAKEAYMRCFDGGVGHDEWVRALVCPVCLHIRKRQESITQACHVTARGMGSANGFWYDLVPLCAKHHDEQGSMVSTGGQTGNAFIASMYGVLLEPLAQQLTEEHLRELGAIR